MYSALIVALTAINLQPYNFCILHVFARVQMRFLDTEIYHMLTWIGSAHFRESVTWTWVPSPHLASLCSLWMARQGTELSCCLSVGFSSFWIISFSLSCSFSFQFVILF